MDIFQDISGRRGASEDDKLTSRNKFLRTWVKDLEILCKDGFSVTVVLASEGYPEKYNSNMQIEGLENKSFLVFHSGTKYNNEKYYSNGGRVINVVGYDINLEGAILNAYNNVNEISFENMYYRKDIGKKGLVYLKGIKNE